MKNVAVRLLLLWPLCACLSPAVADVYRCVEQSGISYQDQPCRGSGSVVRVFLATTTVSGAPTNDALAALRSRVLEIERDRIKRSAAFEIAMLERSLATYDDAKQTELAQFRETMGYINWNYASAVWDRNWLMERIKNQTDLVVQKYDVSIEDARARVAQLRKSIASDT